LLIGILASYALGPVVDWLQAHRIPRAAGAAVVVAIVVVVMAGALYSLQDAASSMIEELPAAAHRVREEVRDLFDGGGNTAIRNIRAAAAELQGAATEATGARLAAPKPAPPPAPESTSAWLRDFMLAQSALALELVEHAPVVLLLTYFLLASGEHFRRKLLKFVGPSRERKKEAERILEEVDAQVQRFLLVTLISNVLVGVFTGLAFWALGMESPVAWGAAAGVLHFIPYLGEVIFAIACGIAAYVQLGTAVGALMVVGASIVVAFAVGLVITTWLQSRYARVNTAVLFIALLFFGSLWGMWGLLLGAPLVAIAKVICDRVEWLKPAGELIGH
jgi:predicted PurR-regulated permease PerM